MKTWKALAQEKRDYILIYTWGAIWGVLYLFFTPYAVTQVFDRVVIVSLVAATLIGGVVAVVGMLSNSNLLIERTGVRILIIGPVAYTIVQLTVMCFELGLTGTTQRTYLVALGFWPVLFLRKRLHVLTSLVKKAKVTPLVTESTDQ